MQIVFLQYSYHSKLFCVCVEGNNRNAFWIEMRSLIEGRQGLVVNSSFASDISYHVLQKYDFF